MKFPVFFAVSKEFGCRDRLLALSGVSVQRTNLVANGPNRTLRT